MTEPVINAVLANIPLKKGLILDLQDSGKIPIKILDTGLLKFVLNKFVENLAQTAEKTSNLNRNARKTNI